MKSGGIPKSGKVVHCSFTDSRLNNGAELVLLGLSAVGLA